MDIALDKYFSQKLFSVNEIELYEEEKSKAIQIARALTKNLGLYYENIDPVVDNYIFNWINLGFSEKMLEEISNYCFKLKISDKNSVIFSFLIFLI